MDWIITVLIFLCGGVLLLGLWWIMPTPCQQARCTAMTPSLETVVRSCARTFSEIEVQKRQLLDRVALMDELIARSDQQLDQMYEQLSRMQFRSIPVSGDEHF